MANIDAVVYCDGACEPMNPGGVATFGWVAYWKGQKRAENCGVACEGDGATNNVAEYSAVINAMEHLLSKKFFGPVLVRSDSQLVINQLNGVWGVKSVNLLPYYREARGLADMFTKQIFFEWVPREQNEVADELSRKAYREHRKNGVKHGPWQNDQPRNNPG